MPRSPSLSFRQAASSQQTSEVDLIFVTITHPLLVPPIRVVNDAKSFVYGGNTFIGFPFDIILLSDDDNAPKAAQISFQNIDSQIGDTIRQLNQAPRVRIELLHSSDFDLTVDPRTPLGTPSSLLMGDKLFLVNTKVDVQTVSGDFSGYDFSQRAWPGDRATQTTFPGLFI